MVNTLVALIRALFSLFGSAPVLELVGIALLIVGTAVIWGPYALLVAGGLALLKAAQVAGEGRT